MYDKLNLLKPQYVDKETGYRYYDIHQNARMDMIAYMKELGMSLAEISDVLSKEDLTLIEEILARKNEQIHGQIRKLHAQHDAIERAIESIERYRKSPTTGTISLEYIDRRFCFGISCKENFYAEGLDGYEKELGTLRSIMRGYISQIDSLNTLNHKLTAEAAAARREAASAKRQNEELAQQVEELSGRVTVGSVIKARGIRMEAHTSADKTTDRSNRVTRLLVNLSLVENELAQRGPVEAFVRVFDPDGNLLSDGKGTTFTLGDETLEATASREVDYQGTEVDLGIYVNNIPAFVKGIYTVQAYTSTSLLGSAELLLR